MGYEDVGWERGWHGSDEYICPACIDDNYLKSVVADALSDEERCSFCDTVGAATFDTFMEAFMVGVNNSYEQADDAGMPWEGGYVFEEAIYTSYDIADAFGWVTGGEHGDQVFEEIRDRLDPDKVYASRWWIELEPEKAYASAWEEFREQIKHRTRFVFWAAQGIDDPRVGAGEVPVAKVLDAIGSLLEMLDLIMPLPAGTPVYRARGHADALDSAEWSAADLGTNIDKNSISSSRMSPAGIPLFYCADDVGTALAEVGHADDREYFTVGRFVTTAPIEIINLVDVPEIPSIFDPTLGKWQGQIAFLNDLVAELSRPVETTRANLDYIPTQVFCEYFLRVFREGGIRGLTWKSAAASNCGQCFALDIPHADCVNDSDSGIGRPQLEFVKNSKTVHRRRTDEFREI